MSSSPARTLLVACGLLVLTNGPVFFINDHVFGGRLGWEQPFTRQVFIATALIATATVALDRFRVSGERLVVPSPVAAAAVIGFTAWSVESSLWSLAPELTRGRSLIYVGLAALAWIIADLEFSRFRAAVALAAGSGVVASLLTVIFFDAAGVNRNGDWQGIYTNRNSLAPVAGVAVIIGISMFADAQRGRRLGAAALTFLSAAVMAGSGSRTAWLALAVAVGGSLLVVATRRGRDRYGARALLAGGSVLALGSVLTFSVISRMWGESTFEQRRTIWGFVWDQIGERPFHGHGWFTIWSVAEFTSADPLLGRGSAHGSFLEVWLGVGLIGLVPFLLIIGLALFGTARAAWINPGVASWTWFALVIFLVIENLTESFVLWYSYNWVLLMAAALRSGVGRRREPGLRTPEPSESVSV